MISDKTQIGNKTDRISIRQSAQIFDKYSLYMSLFKREDINRNLLISHIFKKND